MTLESFSKLQCIFIEKCIFQVKKKNLLLILWVIRGEWKGWGSQRKVTWEDRAHPLNAQQGTKANAYTWGNTGSQMPLNRCPGFRLLVCTT